MPRIIQGPLRVGLAYPRSQLAALAHRAIGLGRTRAARFTKHFIKGMVKHHVNRPILCRYGTEKPSRIGGIGTGLGLVPWEDHAATGLHRAGEACQKLRMAIKKKAEGSTRGAALIKKAIEAAKSNGLIDAPEAVPPGVLKKLRLPNDEKISPAMKELLAFDSSWLGWEIDEEEPELEPMSLDELVEQEFGEEFISQFGEAIELLAEDCIVIDDGTEAKRFLYVGSPDEKGEYAVITLTNDDGCWVGGFVPFDVWVAQQLGAVEKEKHHGYVPQEFEAACKELADSNGDGRVSFKSETREVERNKEGDDEDEDEDEDGDENEDAKDEDEK